MSVRKVRFSWISDSMDGVGAQINLSFNGELLETGLEISSDDVDNPIVKEYEFDLTAGTYNFVLEFLNDDIRDDNSDGINDHDRNLKLVKFEISNDGINYTDIVSSYDEIFENITNTVASDNYIYKHSNMIWFYGDNRGDEHISDEVAFYTLPIIFTDE